MILLNPGRGVARPGRVIMSRVCALGLAFVLGSGSVNSAFAGPAGDRPLAPRAPMLKPDRVDRPAHEHRLTVKFHDHIRARATDAGDLISLAGANLDDLAAARAVHQMTFRPLIQLPDETIAFIERRAARMSGLAQPDLAGMMIVNVAEESIQAAADALLASPLTEWVYFEELTPPPPGAVLTPCSDIPPVTPSYVHLQTYRGPNPGLNMLAAWQEFDARGAGIRIADCEYGYNADHEDLCDIIPEPGQTPHPNVISNGWDEHGTAVLGELVAEENAYGCTGLVPESEAYFFPEWTIEEGSRRVTAIANAIAAMDPGDIVLLEMQTSGPGGGYGPAELNPAVWQVTKAGTDGGVIVVAAAGNGNQDLDSGPYATYRSWGDSGAIIVGAGSANTAHNKLSFSTYGSRVNVQGWGQNVFTLGYGSYAEHGGDKNQRYTHQFSGTSSASPFVTAAAAAIQSVAQRDLGYRLLPLEMRELLIATGIPQGSGGHIGPFPNVHAAIAQMLANAPSADLNGDGVVDVADLLILFDNWGQCQNCNDCPADFNNDCVVNVADLLFMFDNWG
jgi:hypothetical protein